MVEELKSFDDNTLVSELIDGFTKTGEKLGKKLMQSKIHESYDHLNILIKVVETKLLTSDIKVFLGELKFMLNHMQQMKRIATAGDSKLLKSLVLVNWLFFNQMYHQEEVKYFKTSRINEALLFITER